MNITPEESKALVRWYGDRAASMAVLFASATTEAHEEAEELAKPTFPEFGESKAAARRVAWAIINRAKEGVAR